MSGKTDTERVNRLSKREKKPADAEKLLRTAKPLVIVPAILAVFMILFLVLSILLMSPLQNSVFYKVIYVVAGVLTFTLPIPCVACAVIGVVAVLSTGRSRPL